MVDAFGELAGLADAFVETPDVCALEPEAPGAGAFAVGDDVEAYGLCQSPEFNNRRGRVVLYSKELDRWVVLFDEVTRKNLKVQNLRLVVPDASPLEGKFFFHIE